MIKYFETTMLMGFGGIFLGLYAWLCSHGLITNPMDEYFVWKIPMAVFGIFGYALIGLTAMMITKVTWPVSTLVIINHLLVGFASLFTAYLVFKAIQIGLFCPGCIMCWFLNIAFGYRLIIHQLGQ